MELVIGLQTGKFAEDIYFMLLSSPLREQIMQLGRKYGMSDKELRDRILTCINQVALLEPIMEAAEC